MKQTFLILLAVVFTVTLSVAQDIITTKKGEDILAKISESTQTEIRYKLFDHQEGPVYTILKSDILMIRYDNGTKEIFNEESKSIAAPPSNFSGANMNIQQQPDQKLFFAGKAEKAKRMKSTGATLTILGGILFVVGVASLSNATYSTYNGTTTTSNSGEAGAAAFLVGVGALGAGIPLWIVGAHTHRKYEQKFQGITFRLNANPRTTGLTLSYRF